MSDIKKRSAKNMKSARINNINIYYKEDIVQSIVVPCLKQLNTNNLELNAFLIPARETTANLVFTPGGSFYEAMDDDNNIREQMAEVAVNLLLFTGLDLNVGRLFTDENLKTYEKESQHLLDSKHKITEGKFKAFFCEQIAVQKFVTELQIYLARIPRTSPPYQSDYNYHTVALSSGSSGSSDSNGGNDSNNVNSPVVKVICCSMVCSWLARILWDYYTHTNSPNCTAISHLVIENHTVVLDTTKNGSRCDARSEFDFFTDCIFKFFILFML